MPSTQPWLGLRKRCVTFTLAIGPETSIATSVFSRGASTKNARLLRREEQRAAVDVVRPDKGDELAGCLPRLGAGGGGKSRHRGDAGDKGGDGDKT
ncbi:hypothetical protein RCCGEPOP_19163 [Rhizobium sp. Pop5]|nr:hypothetical protein RCCGEPOP_19163 [Rhizobium sp. Pop5]